jgi:Na+-transporting NADH:ubiquinone oxidoreductase subunit NqrB
MRGLRNILETVRPWFDRRRSTAGIESRSMTRPTTSSFRMLNATGCRPYGRDPIDVKRYMSMVILALLPAFAASLYFFGPRVLLLLFVSYLAGGTVEVLFAVVRKHEINEGFLVTGFIFPLISAARGALVDGCGWYRIRRIGRQGSLRRNRTKSFQCGIGRSLFPDPGVPDDDGVPGGLRLARRNGCNCQRRCG